VEGTEDRAACISKNGSKDLVDYTLWFPEDNNLHKIK
jgi:hypothetical protein